MGTRRLAAILAVDVAGFSQRTMADPERAVDETVDFRALVAKTVAPYGGRVFRAVSDVVMAEFPAASDAVEALRALVAVKERPLIRAAVHIGEVNAAGEDLLGHSVNVAERVRRFAGVDEAIVTEAAYAQIRGPLRERLEDIGGSRLEKTDEDIALYRLKPAMVTSASGDLANALNTLWRRVRSRKIAQWGFGYLVTAFGAMQGVAVVVETLGWPPLVARLALAFLATGFPIALIVAWFHGERGRQRVTTAEIISIGAALVAGVVLVAVALHAPTSAAPGVVRTGAVIAVLPFDVTGPDQTDVGKALPGQIVDALLNTGQLQTIAWNSSAQFVGARKSEAAKTLAASYLVDGTVRVDAGAVDVTANLIDAKRSVAVWSQSWRRPLKDVRLVENEIAERVADALNVRVGSHWARARGTIDDDVYNLYLRAREHSRLRGLENGKKAIAELEEVTRRAPDFAAGWSALAVNQLIYPNAVATDPDSATRNALGSARTALRLDPTNGEALGVEARLASTWSEANEKMQQALDLQPYNSTLLNWSGIILGQSGFTVRAVDALERGATLDPLSTAIAHNYVFALADTGRGENAQKVFERLSFLRVQNGNADRTFGEALDLAWRSGNFAEYVSLREHRPPRAPQPAATEILLKVSEALATGKGMTYPALAVEVRDSKALDERHAVEALVLLGDIDDALAKAATLVVRETPSQLPDTQFLFGPLTRQLRFDERFMTLSAQLGLLRYWQKSGRWPDFCADPEIPYSCAAVARRREPPRLATFIRRWHTKVFCRHC